MFTGKGGVGKSTIATACAVAAATHGRRTLLVDFDGRSSCAAAFGVEGFTSVPTAVAKRLDAIALDPKVALDEYLKQHGQGRLARRLGATGLLDVVASAVPGMREILLLGRVKAFHFSGDYDCIIIDGYAAGHTLRLMSSPAGFLDAVRVGPIRQQAEAALEMITNPEIFAVVPVTLPEMTPIVELKELFSEITGVHGIAVAAVVLNACHHDLGATPDEEQLREIFPDTISIELSNLIREVWEANHQRSRAEAAAIGTLNLGVPILQIPSVAGEAAHIVPMVAPLLAPLVIPVGTK